MFGSRPTVIRSLRASTCLLAFGACGPSAADIAEKHAEDARYVSAVSQVLTQGVAPEFEDSARALADSVRRGDIGMDAALTALRARWSLYVIAHPEVAPRLRMEEEVSRRAGIECR